MSHGLGTGSPFKIIGPAIPGAFAACAHVYAFR
jgi:hypothetical protein